MYAKILVAGWGDMDFNGHMRNTAYLDKSGDVRMMFFAEHGFPMDEFRRRGLGPVVMKDEVEYFHEVGLLEEVRVTLEMAALSEDGRRFHMRNAFHKTDGRLAARVTSTGGWLDFAQRRLTQPPEALLAALQALPRSADFRSLPASAAR